MGPRERLLAETQMAADTKCRCSQIKPRQFVHFIRGHLRQGQSTLEYAIFTAVVAAALVGMQTYVRRSIQANLKTMEDRINTEQGLPPAGAPPVAGP